MRDSGKISNLLVRNKQRTETYEALRADGFFFHPADLYSFSTTDSSIPLPNMLPREKEKREVRRKSVGSPPRDRSIAALAVPVMPLFIPTRPAPAPPSAVSPFSTLRRAIAAQGLRPSVYGHGGVPSATPLPLPHPNLILGEPLTSHLVTPQEMARLRGSHHDRQFAVSVTTRNGLTSQERQIQPRSPAESSRSSGFRRNLLRMFTSPAQNDLNRSSVLIESLPRLQRSSSAGISHTLRTSQSTNRLKPQRPDRSATSVDDLATKRRILVNEGRINADQVRAFDFDARSQNRQIHGDTGFFSAADLAVVEAYKKSKSKNEILLPGMGPGMTVRGAEDEEESQSDTVASPSSPDETKWAGHVPSDSGEYVSADEEQYQSGSAVVMGQQEDEVDNDVKAEEYDGENAETGIARVVKAADVAAVDPELIHVMKMEKRDSAIDGK